MLQKILLITGAGLWLNLAAADEGAYVGASVGYANIQNWWSGSLALSVNGGYDFNNHFATEAGITWINPITSTYYASGSSNQSSYSQSQSFADIAAKGSVPLGDIFNLYVKGGLGLSYASASAITNSSVYDWNGASSSFSPGLYLALGGELNIGKGFQATFEDYGLIPFDNYNWGNINIFGVGLKYNF